MALRTLSAIPGLLAVSTAAFAQSAARELRTLSANDSSLAAVSVAAARTLEPSRSGRVQFAGVIVNGHDVRPVSDSVVKAVDAERIDNKRGVPFVVCRSGQSCPELENIRMDKTYSFTSFRALPDTVFVGGTARSIAAGEQAVCIVVARVGQSWIAAGTRETKSAKRCGE